MSPRPRFKETPVDEEKIKHFSKKFEEQDVFGETEKEGHQEKNDNPKLRSVLSKFSEFDDPPEEKKGKEHMKKEEKTAEKQPSKKEDVQLQVEKVVVHEPHPTFKGADAVSSQAVQQQRLTKAEAYAVQQYQAKLTDQRKSSWHAIKIGFFFGLGFVLFIFLIAIILFSVAIFMGVTVIELLQMLI